MNLGIFLIFFLDFAFITLAKERERRQINFGGSSSSSSSSNSRRPSFDNGGSSNSVSFGFPATEKSPSFTNLRDLLDKDGKAPPADVNTRFNFGGGRKKYGTSCTTPNQQAGTCRYIFDSQCSPILNAVLSGGISNQLLNYLYAAIRSPCGFEGFDFTLCCADSGSRPTSRPPIGSTSTTTTTTTTTTQRPTQPRCGQPTTRIVGGEVARPGAWPWMVVLGKPGSFGNQFQVSCGGTILNMDTIITAAHCFGNGNQDPTHAHIGDTDLGSSNDGIGEDITFSQIIRHPNWSARTLENDIAILKLSRPATFSRNVQPACLPYAYEGRDLPSLLRNSQPTVAGWGSTRTGGASSSKLMQAKVPMVTQSECSNAYRNVGQVSIGDTKVCAGTGGRDTCNGDSGGPLLSDTLELGYSIVGITSFGVDCARPDFPGVYTRVDKYLDWIEPLL